MTIRLLGNTEELRMGNTGADDLEPTTSFKVPLIFPQQKTPDLQAVMVHWKSDRSGYEPTILTPEMVNSIGNGSLHIVGYGAMIYSDVFGETHWTRFCNFSMQTPAGQFTPTPVSFTAQEKCMKYNDVDHEPDKKVTNPFGPFPPGKQTH